MMPSGVKSNVFFIALIISKSVYSLDVPNVLIFIEIGSKRPIPYESCISNLEAIFAATIFLAIHLAAYEADLSTFV